MQLRTLAVQPLKNFQQFYGKMNIYYRIHESLPLAPILRVSLPSGLVTQVRTSGGSSKHMAYEYYTIPIIKWKGFGRKR